MITVFGAGSIGCHLGGMLATQGTPVTLIGRPAIVAALGDGYTVSAMDGVARRTQPAITADHAAALRQASTVLLCVKSADTAGAAEIIRQHAPGDTPVISLQNGLTNCPVLADILGAERVIAGMVGYNVVRADETHFAQTTDGDVILDRSGQQIADLLDSTAISAGTHDNMPGVQWSKLLINLNNALNALSGLGLRAQLENRMWRRVLAACIAEGLAVAKAEGVRLERLGKVHPRQLPFLLRLPNFIFLRLAGSMLRISAAARSSMADDFDLGRRPEVDWLNGDIVARAQAHGLNAPVNARVCAAVKAAFADRTRGVRTVSAAELLG